MRQVAGPVVHGEVARHHAAAIQRTRPQVLDEFPDFLRCVGERTEDGLKLVVGHRRAGQKAARADNLDRSHLHRSPHLACIRHGVLRFHRTVRLQPFRCLFWGGPLTLAPKRDNPCAYPQRTLPCPGVAGKRESASSAQLTLVQQLKSCRARIQKLSCSSL